MIFSLFRAKCVPIYTAINANLAWIVQDHLLANGIDANIKINKHETKDVQFGASPSYSVCAPEDAVERAKELAAQCEAIKIAGFLSK